MVSRAELERRGLEGMSDEDYERYIRHKIERREDVQAHEVALRKMMEAGATERKGMTETGLGTRLKRELEFERPEQAARIGELGARTGRAEYGLEFEKGLEGTLSDIIEQKKKLGELDIDVLKKQLEEPKAAPIEKEVAAPGVAIPGVAKPTKGKRRMRPSVKKFLWEGEEVGGGLRAPGLLAPLYGYKNIADWLGHFAKKGYEYAFPRGK